MLNRLRTTLEMPLLRRELTELAQRKSTYSLRCLCLAIFAVVFFVAYAAASASSFQRFGMLGQGRAMVHALYAAMLFTLYALAPALSCGAITSEKEKQTLCLLLITRMSPLSIVLEKVASRMLPLLSLVTVSLPLFCVGWLYGGVSFSEVLWGIVFLLYIVFQITTIAIFCSALLKTSSAAFWSTYLTLMVLYFGLPILNEILELRFRMGTFRDIEFLLFPPYQMAMLAYETPSAWEIVLLTIPSLVITLGFLPAASVALVYAEAVAASAGRILQRRLQMLRRRTRDSANAVSPTLPATGTGLNAMAVDPDDAVRARRQQHRTFLQLAERMSERPIRWRELRSMRLLSRRVVVLAIGGLVCFEAFAILSVRPHNRDEMTVVITAVMLIVTALAVLTLTSKLFARERERQTLDVLLTMPLQNRQLLRDKTAAINQVILLLLALIAICGLLHLCVVDLPMTAASASNNISRLGRYRSPANNFANWLTAAGVYMLCLLSTTVINLNLVKWIAMYFGLKMKTQMRAMTSSLISVLLLCTLPMALLTIAMILTDLNPNKFPLWFYSSPAVLPALNEAHELHEAFRGNSIPDSELLVILIYFIGWGGVMLCVRGIVTGRLGTLLQRLDYSLSSDSTGALHE